jgi:hypothetical protein
MAEIAQKVPKKRQFLFNPLKRPMPYIGLLIAFLIILFQGTIRKITADYVGEWLVSSLRDSTEGNYTLDYDFVRIDIFTKELRIQNLNLALDTTVINQTDYLHKYNNLIDLSTPLVMLKLASIWDLLVNDKLRIEFIGMQEPRVKLTHSQDLSEEEKLENQQVTTEKIKSYLRELEIDSFRILNGAIQVDLQNQQKQDLVGFRIRNFTTMMRGFKLDESRPNTLYQGIYAEELELEILDQEIILPRVHHKIKFERLWVSSRDSIIQFDSLKIYPLESADSLFMGNVSLNQLALRGIDFKKGYDENKFDIHQIDILNPIISLVKKGPNTSANGSDLVKLPFAEINLHEINLLNGRLNLDANRKITSELINLRVNDYKIDSSYIAPEELLKNLRDFELRAEKSSMEMPDSIHQVFIGNLEINSEDSTVLLSEIVMHPITSRRKYSVYKERGVGLINYVTVKEVSIGGFDFNNAIHNQQILIDSLKISSPTANVTQYPYIKQSIKGSKNIPYLIKKAIIENGNVYFNKRQNSENNRSEVQNISLTITNLFPESGNPVVFDKLNLKIRSGFSEIKPIGHTLKFQNLSSDNITDFRVEKLSLTPDSTVVDGNRINLTSTGVSIKDFRQDLLKSGVLSVGEISASTLSVKANLNSGRKKSKSPGPIKKAIIGKLYLKTGDFSISNSESDISFADVSTLIDSLEYSSTAEVGTSPIDIKDMLLSHGKFSLKSKKSNTRLSGKLGRFSESDSLINFEDVTFNSGENISGHLNLAYLKGFDRQALLANNGLKFSYLIFDKPSLELRLNNNTPKHKNINFNSDTLRNLLLKQFSFVAFDSIVGKNADIIISSARRNTEIDNLNIYFLDYLCDTTTTAEKVLQPNQFKINIANITTKGIKDTITVQGVSLDMISNSLFTGNINAVIHNNQGVIKANVPGLLAKGFRLSKILEEDYSMDTIRLSNATLSLNTHNEENPKVSAKKIDNKLSATLNSLFSKSNDLLYDTLMKFNDGRLNIAEMDSSKNFDFKNLLSNITVDKKSDEDTVINHQDSPKAKPFVYYKAHPTNGIINHIRLNNSSFNWLNNHRPHGYLSGLNFSIDLDSLVLDTLNRFNVFNHLENITVTLNDYKTNLPDSLNSLSFEEIKISTHDESVGIKNISLTPRVDKYDYANKVGHQAGWHKLQNLDLDIAKVNLSRLIAEKVLYVQKITTTNGTLDIFKDKELPIPVNQRRQMLQEAIRNIELPVKIDSINVDNFRINFSSRLTSKMPEGSIEFYDLNARVSNLVNIDSIINNNPNLVVEASTKMMNKGLLTANFDFDLGDENNPFKFTAHLSTMSAREFNNILEALAFVSIESGNIKDLSMEVQGDRYYATGNMIFLYDNLKVSTINKKNLKTKGMGKVVKTFFANAFVVKKNNPAFKFFPREGAMYYERDPQKIIIDYVTKTALSGVISSIGARNARKDIKRIQKESKKQKDAERKALKKATKKGIA